MTASPGDEKRRGQAESCHQQVVTAGSAGDVDPVTSGHLVVTPVANQVGQNVTTGHVVTAGDVGDVDPVTRASPVVTEKCLAAGCPVPIGAPGGDGRVVSRTVITARSLAACHHRWGGTKQSRLPDRKGAKRGSPAVRPGCLWWPGYISQTGTWATTVLYTQTGEKRK